MEITIRMNADEMLDAAARGLLDGLAECTKGGPQPAQLDISTAQPQQPATAQAAQPVLVQGARDIAAQTAVPVEAPAQPIRDTPIAVPTQQAAYTQEDLALAATQLVDAGKLQQVQELLAKFGVQALTLLPKEQYGAFAAELRNMGAKV